MATITAAPSVETEAHSRAIVRDAIAAKALGGHLRQVKALTGDTAREYAGRFLIELIQNGYDAQPKGGTVGRLAIHLDRSEGQFGAVYVANTGRPFAWSDVVALSELAQSTKQPGEGIGHKGLGFKSVLQGCRWPEVYSSLGSAPSSEFDGYCFRFAKPEDIRWLADPVTGPDLERILSDLSPYVLPIPLRSQSEHVRRLRNEGYATVVRLPLDSAEGLEMATEQIESMRDETVPVQLFLDRISEIVIEVSASGQPLIVTALTRKATALSRDAGLDLSVVDLGGQGSYFVASGAVAHERLMDAIRESVTHNRTDESWLDWQGEARVSIAVPIGEPERGRLYTYLPMGSDVIAPLAGHVNAPFVTRVARDHLDPSIALNRMLLDVAGEVAAAAACRLPELAKPWTRAVSVDLLSWLADGVGRLAAGFEVLGTTLEQAPILPSVRDRSRATWTSALETRYWPGDRYDVLTGERLRSASGLAFLDPALAPERVEALAAVLESIGRSLSPTTSELAGWVERIAEAAARRPLRRRWWESFYEDLSDAFSGGGEVLHGRRVLIDADGRLRPGGPASEGRRRTAAVFFSPRNLLVDEADETVDDDVDVNVPASLRNHVAFMHPELRWQVMDAAANRLVRRASHRFLEDSRLVTRFRRGTVLQHLVEVLRVSRDKRLHGDALRFVFNLQKGKLPQRPALSEMGFRVPTAKGGLVRGEEANFSAAWPGTQGADLEALLADASGVSASIADIGERLLASPDVWPFDSAATAPWREFLRAVGVRDGLWPVPTGPRTLRDNGDELRASKLSQRFALPVRSSQLWQAAVARSGARAHHPWTTYELIGRVWLLPGQEEYGDLSPATRASYARAVVLGLASWPDEMLTTRFRRPRAEREADPFQWPSPAAAFLTETEWVPTSRPGHPGAADYRRPADAWHYAESDRDPLPQFAPLVATPIRRLLDQLPLAEARLRALGMHLWSDEADAVARLQWMGTLFSDVATTLMGNFRKAYERTWELLSSASLGHSTGDSGALRIVVSRRAQLETADLPSDTNMVIYVPDHEDQLSDLLFRSVDAPMLQVDPAHGQLAMEMLTPIAGEATLRLTSDADLLVTVDAAPVSVGETSGTRLTAEHPWLSDVVALTLELRATQFNRQSEQTVARALSQLARLRIIIGREVRLQLEGHDQRPPPFFSGAVPIKDPDHPTIAIESETEDGIGWDQLIRLAPAIAEILGEQLMASPLENALVALRGQGGEEPYEPTSRQLAVAFRAPVERIDEIRRTRRGSVEHLLELVRPVVAHFAGLDATHLLDAEAEILTVGDVSAALASIASSLPLSLKDLLNVVNEAGDLWGVRRRLNLPFSAFNETLKALGYRPLTNEAGHAAAVMAFVQANREAILGSLRLGYIRAYDEKSSLAQYLEARRELGAIQAPSEWLEAYELPPDDVLQERVDEWLQLRGAGPLAGWTGQLDPIEEIRRDNRLLLQEAAGRLQQLVLAWSARQGVSPPTWADEGAHALVEVLDSAGLLEFRRIAAAEAPHLLATIGAWPEGMAASTDLGAHALEESDLVAQATVAERDRWRRQQERAAIRLDGVLMPATDDNLAAIAEAVRRTASAAVARSDKGESSLMAIKQRRRRRPKNGGGPRVGPRDRITDAQRTAIGLAGEVVAFEWLREHYGVTPEAWVSTNRRFLYGDNLGDDGLGYDFRLPLRRTIHFFEVKATPGDRGEIELSEAELAAAREHAQKDRYHILFVPHVLDSDSRRVHMLPNPLHVDARDLYAWVGTGMRYRFDLPVDE